MRLWTQRSCNTAARPLIPLQKTWKNKNIRSRPNVKSKTTTPLHLYLLHRAVRQSNGAAFPPWTDWGERGVKEESEEQTQQHQEKCVRTGLMNVWKHVPSSTPCRLGRISEVLYWGKNKPFFNVQPTTLRPAPQWLGFDYNRQRIIPATCSHL